MDHRSTLILAVSLLCGSAFAGYAQLAPPSGWSGGGGAAATYRYPSAANAAAFSNGTVLTNASLSVGGRAVSVPASMRLAANAPRIAAAVIFAHPALRTAAAVATWLGAAGLVYSVADGLWKKIDPDAVVSDGYIYQAVLDGGGLTAGHSTELAVVEEWFAHFVEKRVPNSYRSIEKESFIKISSDTYRVSFQYDNYSGSGTSSVNVVLRKASGSCPSGWYQTPGGCVQNPPMKTVTKEEFEQLVPDARPMPPELPGVVWPASWPVEAPEIQPMFIPTGNPVKNPAYDPAKPTSPENQPWLQPGVKLSPAPMPSSPWNVDLQPVNRPVDKPIPNPDPVVDPVPNPDGSGNTDKPRDPEKDQRDLCEKYPEILACQKLDEPEDPGKLKTKAVDLDFQVQGGYAGSAVCPAPMTYQAFDRVLTLSWQPFCDSLAMVKNLLLAFAWISAAFILLGAKKE